MTVISISEAARTWRIARSTLQRAIQEGKLSATTKADGSRGIDTAELIRVFGEAPAALQERGEAMMLPALGLYRQDLRKSGSRNGLMSKEQ